MSAVATTLRDFRNRLARKEYAFETDGDATTVTHAGGVYLPSLTTLPEGTRFDNAGYVDLGGLTTLPEGTRFDNAGCVYLVSLDGESVVYQGERRAIRHIDGSTMIITSRRTVGGVVIMRARYFRGGPVADMPKCYIAEVGGFTAHGATRQQAIGDARYKQMHATMDVSAVVAKIEADGVFTRETFRLLTGACGSGTERFLDEHGLADKQELPIAEVVAITRGAYGGDVVARHFGEFAP